MITTLMAWAKARFCHSPRHRIINHEVIGQALLGILRWGLLLMLLAAACSSDEPTLVVAAASDLLPAMDELVAIFQQECGCRFRVTFGSSGTLVYQIRQRLPADVFLSADASYVDALAKDGYTQPGTERVYALGLLALAVPKGGEPAPKTLDELTAPRFNRIVIANPEYAPYGRAAQEALQNAGLWEVVQPRIVLAESASHATQLVKTGDAQAGIIPLSSAIASGDRLAWTSLPPQHYSPLSQKAAVLAHAPSPELGRRFLDFLTGPHGREVLRKYGFIIPEGG